MYLVQKTQAGIRSPLGPATMPGGVFVVRDRSIARSIFSSFGKSGLKMLAMEKGKRVGSSVELFEEKEEFKESGDPQLLEERESESLNWL